MPRMQIRGIRKEESLMPYKGTVIHGKPFLSETSLVSHSIPVIHNPKPRHDTDSLARLSRQNSRDARQNSRGSGLSCETHPSLLKHITARLNSRGSAYKASLLKTDATITPHATNKKNLQTIRLTDSTEPATDDKLTVTKENTAELNLATQNRGETQ